MHKIVSKRFFLILVFNLLLAMAAYLVLGGIVGWLAPGRSAAGITLGDGIPTLQFIAMAALLDLTMWAMASRGVTGRMRVPPLALQIVTFVIYAVMISAAINLVFKQSLAAILGASGVIGLVLGFALRGLVADVFSGIALQIDPSLKPGEWLEFQYRGKDMSGKLIDIAWRTVIFADRAENIVLIPNGEFATMLMTNRSRPSLLTEYGATIDLRADLDEVHIIAILQNALHRAAREGAIAEQPRPYVRILSVKEGIISFRMFYCLDMNLIAPLKASHIVLGFALQFLKAAGIPVTFSQRIEASRPVGPGAHHLDQAEARLSMLASVRFLSILPPADLATVATEIGIHRLTGGHGLLVAGEPGESMFVVSEGSLDVVIDTAEGPVTVAQLWPGDCLGEMSLFTGEPRTAHVRTRESSVVFEIGKSTMAGIFKRNPALIQRIAEMIASRQKSNQNALDKIDDVIADAATSFSILENIRRFFQLRPAKTMTRKVPQTVPADSAS